MGWSGGGGATLAPIDGQTIKLNVNGEEFVNPVSPIAISAAGVGFLYSTTNVWTGSNTFAASLLKLKGAGAGIGTFTYANSTLSTTITVPAGTDTLVNLNSTQTLTNKSLTSPALTTPTLAGAGVGIGTIQYANSTLSTTITIPAGTDSVVNLNGTQTLTNKTFTSPIINSATINTATVNTATLPSPIITGGEFNNTANTTLSGTTTGSVIWSMPQQGSSWKVFIAQAAAYENASTVAQTIAFTTAFAYTPLILGNDTGMIISASTSTLTLPASMGSTASGNIIIAGS